MKIQKQFAPMTIILETKQDLDDLLVIIHRARWEIIHPKSMLSKLSRDDADTLEKIEIFLKDLK
jgi:hypothetical protein